MSEPNKRVHVVRLDNLIVMVGAIYRFECNRMWIKYEALDHQLHSIDIGPEIKRYCGLVRLKGPHHSYAYFTVREPVEGGHIDRLVCLQGAATFQFSDLCQKYDVSFHTDNPPLLAFRERHDHKLVKGTAKLAYMVPKEQEQPA